MKLRYVLLILIAITAGEMHAARSSSRNFKSLKQLEEERIAAEKAKAEADKYSDNKTSSQQIEKVKFLGPKNGWGFVKNKCSHFSPAGKNLGELEAGTLFKYQDIKSTSREDMLLGNLRDSEGWHGPFLLPCTDIAAYEGDPEKVDAQIVADLRRYFLLKGEFDQYRDELLTSEYKKNPHFDSYQQAVEQYKETLDKAGSMEEDAAKLTGADKSRAYDELRKYKYEQEKLKVNLDQIAEKYKAWKKEHPVNMKKLDDDRLLALQDKMNEIRNRFPELIPPEE